MVNLHFKRVNESSQGEDKADGDDLPEHSQDRAGVQERIWTEDQGGVKRMGKMAKF